jgi:hypothetical protein
MSATLVVSSIWSTLISFVILATAVLSDNILIYSFGLFHFMFRLTACDSLKFIRLGSPFHCRSCQKVRGILEEALFCDKFW